jgi:hypothetical protein
MRRMIQAFGRLAAAGAHRNTALLMLAEFVLKLSLEPLPPETKCRAIKALLDTFRPTPRPKRSWRKHEFLRRNCQERKR